MVFGRNFCNKQQIWGSEPYFGEVRGDARRWLMSLWKAHGQLSICINFFCYLLRFCSCEAKCVQHGCFHRGIDLFALKFYLDSVVPNNHSWHQKTIDTGLPNGEDHILRYSLVLTKYQSAMDRRIDG